MYSYYIRHQNRGNASRLAPTIARVNGCAIASGIIYQEEMGSNAYEQSETAWKNRGAKCMPTSLVNNLRQPGRTGEQSDHGIDIEDTSMQGAGNYQVRTDGLKPPTKLFYPGRGETSAKINDVYRLGEVPGAVLTSPSLSLKFGRRTSESVFHL
ncbi:hypothetical protein RRG08_015400 [Elysia crispata]|uniref:Uncharacterized protein n=1 Tax=Elysia crispata TaxID=231223 RepID=A0AAE1ATI9_9GAST|nr:hypothetical protein RRG08_015400 [Elysia crispata]